MKNLVKWFPLLVNILNKLYHFLDKVELTATGSSCFLCLQDLTTSVLDLTSVFKASSHILWPHKWILICYYTDHNIFKVIIIRICHIWRSPSLSELIPIIYNMELTHLGLEASIYKFFSVRNWRSAALSELKINQRGYNSMLGLAESFLCEINIYIVIKR